MNESKAVEYLDFVRQWVLSNETLLAILGGVSVAMFFGTLAVLGTVIVSLPEGYFLKSHRESPRQPISNPGTWFVYLVVKNMLGAVLIFAGIAMLFLPGQGMLSILIGVSIASFPGKRRMIRFLVGRKAILKSANWLRQKFGRAPFRAPESD